MSIKIRKIRFLTAGLFVGLSCGLALGAVAEAGDPMPSDSTPANGAPGDREEFLLLTDGRLIQGVVMREGSTYVVTVKLGVIRFPERLVEGTFPSVREAYRYKRERLAESDPGERMKLAQWCITLGLTAEAQEQLRKVLEISPEHTPAKAMLAKIGQSEALAARRKRDPDVQQTRAEAVAEDRPGALDAAVLRGAHRGMGIPALPEIFDLPRPLAIKRADEFTRFVHPVLQAYCAKCHDGEHGGDFQLVPIKNRRDQTPDALRANLDATLSLINRENPSDSRLLTSVLRPHGNGRNKRPIFPGSNNRAYQILATWVNSLGLPRDADPSARPAGDRSGPEPAEVFAADRARGGGPAIESRRPRPVPGNARVVATPVVPDDTKISPSYRYVPGRGMVAEDRLPPDPREFPLSPLLGRPQPAVAGGSDPSGVGKPAARPPRDDTSPEARPPQPASQATPPPGGVRGPGSGEAPQPAPTESTTPAKSGTAKKTSKPLNLDPVLLQRVLLNRNGGR